MSRIVFLPVRLAALVFFFLTVALSAQTPARLPAVIDEHQLIVLKGNTPPQALVQNDRGAVAGNLPMNRMVLLLKRSEAQEATLRTAIQTMHDPKSPQYHQWLTPQQFGTLYGPADSDIAVVTGWLQGHGFQVNAVAKGKGTIEFSGSADQVAAAFHTTIHSYVVDSKPFFANASDPSIPQALSSVVGGILSLNNFVKTAHSRLQGKEQIVHTGPNRRPELKPDANLGSGNAVGPGDLWTIYNAAPLITAKTNAITGAGQTIAIVGRSDLSIDDITGFRQSFLPAPYASLLPFTQINNGPDPGINADGLEQALDVEYSSALAPAAQIDLVVSGSTNTTDGVDLSASYIVDNNLAAVMSTSYGSCEAAMGVAGNAFYNALWQQAAAQGITSMVSSGDNGSAACDQVGPSGNESVPFVADEGLQVSGVASTPYNIAVGGNEFTDDSATYWSPTSLAGPAPLTTALSYIPEAVWNSSCSPLVCGDDGADIAAGSGGKSGCFTPTIDSTGNISACSGGYAEPDWQAGVAGLTADNARHLPDISLNASGHDGYLVCFQGSCDSGQVYVVGGTSASSPSFAGIMALVNQQTGSRQGQANYTLYRLAASEYGSAGAPNTANLAGCGATQGNAIGSSCIFYDVTTGTNAVPCDGGRLNCSSTTLDVYGVLTGYAAGTGYDNATGLGSVNVTNLVNHWNDTTLATTSTKLAVGSASSTFGQPVTVAVTVASTSGSGTPTGTVALITDAPTASGAGSVLLTNGAYNGTISSLPGGTYSLSARYAGDANFSTSTSSGSKITVNPAGSSAQLAFAATDAVSGAPFTSTTAPYGSIIKATATLTGVTGQTPPTGTVLFKSGSTTLTSQITDPTGLATYTSNSYALGTYTWTAAYGGDADYTASVSPAASFTVGQAATTLRLLSNTSYVVGSNTATLTAIVLTDSFLSNPSGNVVFSVNGTAVNTTAVTAYVDPSTGTSEAVVTFTLPASALTAGSNKITANYAGDTNYVSSSSATVLLGYSAVVPVNTITLAVSSGSVTIAQPVTITATVTTGGIPATAGTVTFFDGTTALASAQVVGSSPGKNFTTGTAVLKTTLGRGAHNLTAVYAGIVAAPTAVTSAVVPVSVTGTSSSTTSLSASPNASDISNYDLTATVSAYGVTAPTGSVDFAETTVVSDLGSSTIDPTKAVQAFLAPAYASDGDPTGASPSQAVVADFNGDGIPDVAIATASFTQSSLSILLGNGDGTYKTPGLYTAGIFADAVAVGDFNNDGNLDVAITSQYNSTFSNGVVSIFLGNGDGTFQPQLVNNMPGNTVNTVVADFNRDGILDIASVQYYPMQITVEFGNGDGTFGAPTNYPLGYNDFSAYYMAAGDFNGDGAIDLVEVNSQDKSAEVFLNAGDGTFTQGPNLTTGVGPQWVSVADVNLDGKQDVIVSNYSDNTIGVFLGNGDGTFQNQVTSPVKGYASSLAIVDIDGDGKPDVAASYYVTNPIGTYSSVGILKGNGDGTFGVETDIATNQVHGGSVALNDMNGDGTLDLISLDPSVTDPQGESIATLLNVKQVQQIQQNVTIDGPLNAQQEAVATYSGDTLYNASSSAGVFVQSYGSQATPVILWTPAAAWGAGVPLGTAVLNATTSGVIPGSFTYTAQLGTGVAVVVTPSSIFSTTGAYTITATFTPTEATSYTTATASRTVAIVSPDFTIQTGTPSVTITAGNSGTLSVTSASLYGFSGQIALGSGNLPGGFTITASPATIATGATSTITVQTTGLNPTTGKLVMPPTWNGWTATGGIAIASLLILPLLRRRRRSVQQALALLVCITIMAMAQGCGEGYSGNSTVALSTSAASVASGSSVTLTAKLGGGHSSFGGTVTFYSGDAVLGKAATVSGSTATLSLTSLPVGLNSLTATYSGDAHNAGGTSNALPQLITGTTSVQITGTSGPTTHSTTVQIVLQ